AYYGYESIVELLLDRDDIDLGLNNRGRSPIHCAIERGFSTVAWRLLEAEMSLDPKTSAGRTPLSWVSENDKTEEVSLLLGMAAIDPNLQDKGGRTPLSRAAENGNVSVVLLLLESGDIDANRRDRDGQTAVSRAAKNGHTNIVQLLSGKDTVTLHSLVREGDLELLKFIIDCGYNVNFLDDQGHTALHNAIVSRQLDIARQLISSGADVSAKNLDGTTPLCLAVQHELRDFVELLLENSASMEDITTAEWRRVYTDSSARPVLLVSEKAGGKRRVEFLEQASHPPRSDPEIEKSLFLFEDFTTWSRCLPSNCTSDRVPDDTMNIICPKEARGSDVGISIAACVPLESIFESGIDGPSYWDFWEGCGVAWIMTAPSHDAGPGWTMKEHFSTLPDGWIPDDGIDFFQQLVVHLTKGWSNLCHQTEGHLSHRRMSQLHAKGQEPDTILHLAEDAQKLANLRECLQGQVLTAREFVVDYSRRYGAGNDRKAFEEIHRFADVGNHIKNLEQTVRDLLQQEFAWVSINEAHRSTSLATSMKRLSWITFIFLPAMFASSLFGMNVDILEDNPDWRWYLLFVGSLLLLTIVGWLFFKYFQFESWVEKHIGRRIQTWATKARAPESASTKTV
ncbi:ankyrin, partial [Fusarium albosuccineum]